MHSTVQTLVNHIETLGCEEGTNYILFKLFDNEWDDIFYHIDYNDLDAQGKTRREYAKEVLSELGVEHIQSEGGGEGGSEHCEGVIRIGEEYFKAEWSYYSHQGCEYDWIEDTITPVKPRQVTVTVYE